MKLGYLIIAALIIAGFNGSTANAASGLKIYDYTTKRTTNYTEKKVNVTYNGSSIGNSKYPGILVDGIALLPYYDIFDASDIDADCVYDSKNNTITISKYGITIKMTIGSKKATVNSKTVTLPVAPMRIKYVAANKTKVLVPSRFVCETLGLGYTWNSNKSTVAIKKDTLSLSYNGGEKFEYSKAQGKVIINGKSVNLGSTPSLIINNTAMLCAYKVFASSSIGAEYTYNKANETITFTKGSNTLVMTVGRRRLI
jgi:N-acetylmuramoyl-L-alanine amidase